MTATPRTSRWSAPVRYVETDQQGVVFNAHYLTYCDEALAQFCRDRALDGFAEDVMLKTSTLTWSSAARFGDVVDVDVTCTRIGRTSIDLRFVVATGQQPCCTVETTYVFAPEGTPVEVPDPVRTQLA